MKFDDGMIEYFREDPAFAAALVTDILEDGDDQGELKSILELIAAAGIRLSVVAEAQARPRRQTGTTERKSRKRAVRARRGDSKPAVAGSI